ncbi:pyridine nucleotide-disulfide oxidoreductase-domain-containing protein [Phlyctochytrium arcticum]|nr:pyridine nucleotide-disulfide oxidoreductase-domain-containing protein [Phlyctochytrium arcticum]
MPTIPILSRRAATSFSFVRNHALTRIYPAHASPSLSSRTFSKLMSTTPSSDLASPPTTGKGNGSQDPKGWDKVQLGSFAASIVGASCVLAATSTLLVADAVESPAELSRTGSSPLVDKTYPTSMVINGKELPVVTLFGDDTADVGKPRLVVLGSGWGATSVIKDLKANGYYTVVVSPTNYFLFTPLLPEATTGTVEARSLIESIRKICIPSRSHYCQGESYDVHLNEKVVEIVGPDGKHFLIPYDILVVAVGAQNATLGVPGVQENARFLKTIADARKLRAEIMTNFELAALPTTSESERKRLLSFVIAGGGPTGVEFASELNDFCKQDLQTYFPELTHHDVRLTIIQSGDHILNMFSLAIAEYAEKKFKSQNIEVITNARVMGVNSNSITYRKKHVKEGEQDTFDIPFGICLWSTGIGMREITERLVKKLAATQENTRALEVDSRLRLKGDPDVYAIGDCATVENPHMLEMVKEQFKKLGCEQLTYNQFQSVVSSIIDRHPQTAIHLTKLAALFDLYDFDKNHTLDIHELSSLLDDVHKKLTSLPATAQVARQQGEYIARKLNALAFTPLPNRPMAENALKPFSYKHLGSFSYVGDSSAVIDWGTGSTNQGFGVFLVWRAAYLAKQVSARTRALLAVDWIKSKVFGRDLSKL